MFVSTETIISRASSFTRYDNNLRATTKRQQSASEKPNRRPDAWPRTHLKARRDGIRLGAVGRGC